MAGGDEAKMSEGAKQPGSRLNLSVQQPVDKERKCGTYMQWNMT